MSNLQEGRAIGLAPMTISERPIGHTRPPHAPPDWAQPWHQRTQRRPAGSIARIAGDAPRPTYPKLSPGRTQEPSPVWAVLGQTIGIALSLVAPAKVLDVLRRIGII